MFMYTSPCLIIYLSITSNYHLSSYSSTNIVTSSSCAQTSGVTLSDKSDCSESRCSKPDMASILQLLREKVSEIELNQKQMKVEFKGEARELRSEIANLKLQKKVTNASVKFYQTSTSLPAITSTVQPTQIERVSSRDNSRSPSPPKRTRGVNLRPKTQIQPPIRYPL